MTSFGFEVLEAMGCGELAVGLLAELDSQLDKVTIKARPSKTIALFNEILPFQGVSPRSVRSSESFFIEMIRTPFHQPGALCKESSELLVSS